MKRRLLSAFLVVCMMLTMIPSVAFAADGEGEPGTTLPPETCTVEYKEQSEGVEYIGAEYVEKTFILDFEITENAPSDDLVIDLGSAMMIAFEETGEYVMPGDTFKYQVQITNNSGKTYIYKDGSLVISTADTDDFGSLEEGSLLPVLGYDGQYLPTSFAGHMLPGFFGFGTNFEELCQVYDYLKEQEYTGENALTRYMLDTLNEEHGTEYTSLADLVIEHPSWLSTSSGVEHNGIYTMSETELLSYIEQYPWIDKFVYAKPNGDQLDVQIKWPEGELAVATYDAFYQQLLSFVFGKENVERLNPNPSGDLDFARAHGIGQYQNGSTLYEEANQYFKDLMANGLQDDATLELDLAWGLDGPTSNMYQNYEFSFYNVIELEEVKPLEPGEGNWEVSKSKTATPLDSNYQSKVTLSLPASEEELVSDVVFVLDESSAYEAVVDEMDTMLQELAQQVTETGATVNVGFVVFRGDAQIRPLEQLTEENISAINAFITTRPETPGSNMMAGLEAARQMLEADTEVADNRKYMIVVSDGITYTWTGEDGVQKGINFANGDAPDSPMLASPDSWDTKYGFNNKYVPADWNQHLQTVEGMLENTIAEKASNYVRGVDINENPFVAYSEKDDYASSVDIALYQCAQIYQALDAKYNCYTVMRSAPLGSGVEADNYPFGPSFMEYLGGDLVDFSQIEKDIYYALDAGSRVEDVIGSGTDNKGAEYNFDFVDDASALQLTVGGVPYIVKPNTPESTENETACYLFLESQTAENASFVLHYYENGKDGNSDECFVWDINVPVSNFAPVQLTYTVELMNPSEVSGTHGQYDEDGHAQYDSLKTNLEAILYPVDSNGTAGRPE